MSSRAGAALRRSSPFVACLLSWALVSSLPAWAAPQDESVDAGFSGEVSVGYVLIPVIVRGPKGFVEGLGAEDFELTVNGRSIGIDSFSIETDAPIDLLVLQDLSGSMAVGGKIEHSRRLLRCLLADRRSGDGFGLAAFGNGRFWVSVPPASPAEQVLVEASRYEAFGTTALHDAVSWIPELGRAGAGRRATVIITDGVDNASRVSSRVARELLEDAAMPIYTIDLRATRSDRSAEELAADERIETLLRDFARVSGGRYLPSAPRDSPAPVCATIHDDLRRHYLLGFPTRGARRRAQYDIDVRVPGRKGRKLSLNFRRSYRGGAPGSG